MTASRIKRASIVSFLLLAGCFALPGTAIADDLSTSAVGAAIAATLDVAQVRVDQPTLVTVYAARADKPVWLDESGTLTAAAQMALTLIADAPANGLNPEAYRLNELQAMAKPVTAGDAASFDLLLSDSIVLYLHDLSTGRTPVGQFERDSSFQDIADRPGILAAVAPMQPDDLRRYAESAMPQEPDYAALKKALADLRQMQAAGGWQALPDGPSLKPGMSDPVVPKLRARLSLPPVAGKGANKFDDQTAGALKAFQETHAIKDDGTLGKDTRAALNMPVDGRIAEVIAAMERWRWLPHDLGPRYVMVDVGGFWVRYIDNGQLAMQLPVIVGTTERETPLLISTIEQAVVNPTWTVPPTIIRKDILPKLRADPNYLEKKGIKLYRRSGDGLEEVGASGYDGGSEYVLRQPAGKENPLGLYKLLFKNPYSIYLHDTPEKKKFDAALRTFSSGCVRVENVRQLFEALLAGQRTPQQIDDDLATGKTKTIRLDRPLPIYIDYLSAWLDPQGNMIFGPDLYNRDNNLAQAVQAPRS